MKEIVWKFHMRGPKMKCRHRFCSPCDLWQLKQREGEQERNRECVELFLIFSHFILGFLLTAALCQHQRESYITRCHNEKEEEEKESETRALIFRICTEAVSHRQINAQSRKYSYPGCQRPERKSLRPSEYRSTNNTNWHEPTHNTVSKGGRKYDPSSSAKLKS